MRRLDLKVGFSCNNHCLFCVQGRKRCQYQDQSFSQIQNVLYQARLQCQEVVFTGGEVTIREDLFALVRYAKFLGYKVHIQSNGRRFFYPDFCKRMVDSGVLNFTLAIHGHNQKVHDYLTGVKGSFTQTLFGIKNLVKLGVNVFTNTVITKTNYQYLPNLADLCIELGVKEYQLSFPHILGSALENQEEIIPRKSEVAPYLYKAINKGRLSNSLPKTEAIPYCFLNNFIQYIGDSIAPQTKVFDNDSFCDFTWWKVNQGKVKGLKCKECKYEETCEGPWREYVDLFGWEEFIPIKKEGD